jgi:hypothetical protein
MKIVNLYFRWFSMAVEIKPLLFSMAGKTAKNNIGLFAAVFPNS